MTTADRLTVAELRALIEQWHCPSELAHLAKRAHDHGLIDASKSGELGRIGKWVLEEVVPLYSLGWALEAGADDRAPPVEVRAFFGYQPEDAEIRFRQTGCAKLLQVQITCAMIDGFQDALSMEHMRAHGHATPYPFVEYERDKRNKLVIPKDYEPPAQDRSSLEKRIVELHKRRRAEKQPGKALQTWRSWSGWGNSTHMG